MKCTSSHAQAASMKMDYRYFETQIMTTLLYSLLSWLKYARSDALGIPVKKVSQP